MSVIFNIVTLLDDHPISHHLSCAPSHPPWWLQLPTPLLGSLAVEPPQLRTVGIFAPKLPWKSWGKMSFYRVFCHVLHHQNWINLDLWFSRCSDNPIWCSQFLIPFLTIRLSFVTISAASPESCSTWEESDGSCFCTLKLGGFYLRLIKLISFHIYQTYFSDLCNLMWSISSLYLCISISSDCHGKIVESHCSSGCQVGLSQGSHMTEQSRDVVLEALRLAVQNWSMTCCIDCDSNDWSIFMATSETPPTIWFLFAMSSKLTRMTCLGWICWTRRRIWIWHHPTCLEKYLDIAMAIAIAATGPASWYLLMWFLKKSVILEETI